MFSRRRMSIGVIAVAFMAGLRTSVRAQQIVHIGRDSPERKAILDVVRVAVERLLGIKVIFVVERMTVYGDWAFVALHPRNEAGQHIDYRRTLIGKDFDPDQDSDYAAALLRRNGPTWTLIEDAFLPNDVVWVDWETKHKLPHRLFIDE